MKLFIFLVTALFTTMSTQLPAHAQTAEELTPEALTERGIEQGATYPGLAKICTVGQPRSLVRKKSGNGGKRRRLTEEERAKRRAKAYIEPTRVFDNLYFVGTKGVAGWAIATSDGIILIDAMNNNFESQTYIDGGLRKLGLDPKDVKYLIITHAHGDHYGGQEYLVRHYAPRIIMSDLDWTELEKPVQEFTNPRWGEAPKRDMSVVDGDSLTLGDTTIEFVVTPGHTPGTLSMIFPVRDGEQIHHVGFWGGTGIRFGDDTERLETYARSAERMLQLAKEASVDVFLTGHPSWDNAVDYIKQLPLRKTGTAHPFVTGHSALAAFGLLRDCSQARADDNRRQQPKKTAN